MAMSDVHFWISQAIWAAAVATAATVYYRRGYRAGRAAQLDGRDDAE